MKRFLVALIMILFMSFLACAQQTILIPGGGTVAWDAPTEADGTSIPASELTYAVYISFYPVANPQDISSLVLLGFTDQASMVFSVSTKGRKIALGVSAIRTDGEGDSVTSGIHWSFDTTAYPGPWVVKWLPAPNKPKNIKVQ